MGPPSLAGGWPTLGVQAVGHTPPFPTCTESDSLLANVWGLYPRQQNTQLSKGRWMVSIAQSLPAEAGAPSALTPRCLHLHVPQHPSRVVPCTLDTPVGCVQGLWFSVDMFVLIPPCFRNKGEIALTVWLVVFRHPGNHCHGFRF